MIYMIHIRGIFCSTFLFFESPSRPRPPHPTPPQISTAL